jgi:hypothetical protein
MAAPNMLTASNITVKTAVQAATTSLTNVVTNGAGSGTAVKINALLVSNYTNTAAGVYVDVYRSSTSYLVAGNVSVPAYSTMVVVAKDAALYLEEGDSLRANCNAANTGYITCSYDIIS